MCEEWEPGQAESWWKTALKVSGIVLVGMVGFLLIVAASGCDAAPIEERQQEVIAINPGSGYCHHLDPQVYGPAPHHAWIWVAQQGGGWWCIQMPLGAYSNIASYDMDNKVVAVRPGLCTDVLLGEHPNWGGAVNLVYDDTNTTQLDSWWRVRVSAIDVRPLWPTNYRGEDCTTVP